MTSNLELIKIIIPIFTFIAGYCISFFIEKHKSKQQRINQSLTSALALLNEWHGLIADLLYVCLRGLEEKDIAIAIQKYTSRKDIAYQINHHLKILEKEKKYTEFVKFIRSNTAMVRKDRVQGDEQYARVLSHADTTTGSHISTNALHYLKALEHAAHVRQDDIGALKQEIANLYGRFDETVKKANELAADLLSK